MAITSTIHKVIERIKNASGDYETVYRKTLGELVEFKDGKTAESKVGGIDGIANNLVSTNSRLALSASQGKNLQDQVKSHLAENVTQPSGAHGFKVESGTWIPTLRTATSTGQYSYSAREGVYARQGNKVLVQFNLAISGINVPADEVLYISGLPYIPNPSVQSEAISSSLVDATGLSLESHYWMVSGRCMTSGIVLYKMAPNAVAVAGMRPANVKVGSVFRGSIEYKI